VRVIENIHIWAYEVSSKRTVGKKLHYEKLSDLLSSANFGAIKCAGMRRTDFVVWMGQKTNVYRSLEGTRERKRFHGRSGEKM
jgi:hypothetical protein